MQMPRRVIRRLLLLGLDLSILTGVFLVLQFAIGWKMALDTSYGWGQWLLMLTETGLFLALFRCHDSLWRYEESKEYLMLFWAMLCSFSMHCLIDQTLIKIVLNYRWHYSLRFILLVDLASLVGMWVFRFFWRYIRTRDIHRSYAKRGKKKMIILGAGDAGVALMEDIRRDPSVDYMVFGFFDDNSTKLGSYIHGVPVLGKIDQLPSFLETTDEDISEIVFAIPSVTDERQREILEMCSKTGLRVRVLPRTSEWLLQSTASVLSRVRDVKVEDLLGRDAITFDNQEVYDFLQDKVVMVTGGGGSIGSELCRQISLHHPARLIIVDIYENNAYDIQQELRYRFKGDLNLSVEIASVRDKKKMDFLVRKYRPQVFFHAAAHKHVPLMEDCPEEAIKNNVFGTANMTELAGQYEAEKFILISTDKAVNPTNVMGASKRMCEMVIQSMQERFPATKFVAVRFGNVLGSNGSVIPLFKRQLQNGGPLTVTDRRIIRYFMTIPEAAQLVMQAGAMADSSQIFVLDMGEPVKILSLAENLIRLSGLTPYRDIDIIETGLRPGEKLYEELLMDNDKLSHTKYNKIFVEQRESIPYEAMQNNLQILRDVLETEDKEQIVRVMRQIVPNFRTPEEVNNKVGTK